jgi:hypothetical protein
MIKPDKRFVSWGREFLARFEHFRKLASAQSIFKQKFGSGASLQTTPSSVAGGQ